VANSAILWICVEGHTISSVTSSIVGIAIVTPTTVIASTVRFIESHHYPRPVSTKQLVLRLSSVPPNQLNHTFSLQQDHGKAVFWKVIPQLLWEVTEMHDRIVPRPMCQFHF